MGEHQFAHGADTAAFCLGDVHLMQHGRNARVAGFRARFAQLFFRFDGMPRVANLQPIGITDDLDRTVNAVAAVHDGVDNGLTDNPQRNPGLVFSRQSALGQRERLDQFIAHCIGGAPDGGKQWGADFQGVEPVIGVFHPLPTGYPDVIDAHHGKTATQGHGRAKQDDAGHRGLE